MALALPTPAAMRELSDEIEKRISQLPSRVINEYGYDPWGYSPRWAKPFTVALGFFYRYWFRVETEGIENLPRGRMLVIGNHAGNTFAWDAAMTGMAMQHITFTRYPSMYVNDNAGYLVGPEDLISAWSDAHWNTLSLHLDEHTDLYHAETEEYADVA